MVKAGKNKAFSMVEALISASILVVVMVVAISSTTKKKPKELDNIGYYRCSCVEDNSGINPNSKLESFYIVNNKRREGSLSGGRCAFYPPSGVDMFSVLIWNENSYLYNSKENAYSYAVKSIPKVPALISLGNSFNPDISIEDVIYMNEVTPGFCHNNVTTKEECENSGANFVWIPAKENREARCVLEGISQMGCQDEGLSWWPDNNDNYDVCMPGANLEISW